MREQLSPEELDRIYIEGYERIPEDPELAKAYEAEIAHILPVEDWSEIYERWKAQVEA